jgi:hypothetical protein
MEWLRFCLVRPMRQKRNSCACRIRSSCTALSGEMRLTVFAAGRRESTHGDAYAPLKLENA